MISIIATRTFRITMSRTIRPSCTDTIIARTLIFCTFLWKSDALSVYIQGLHVQVPKTVRRFGNIPQDAQIFIMDFERTTIRLSVALTRTAFDGFGGRF